ncbi:hypothetical protein BJX64DRAFT_160778 [Aspergillus heterothallicus]
MDENKKRKSTTAIPNPLAPSKIPGYIIAAHLHPTNLDPTATLPGFQRNLLKAASWSVLITSAFLQFRNASGARECPIRSSKVKSPDEKPG